MNANELSRMNRYIIFTRVMVSLIGAGALSFAIWICHSEHPDATAMGLVMIIFAGCLAMLIYSFRWYRRSLWVYSNTTPIKMTIKAREIKWADGRYVYEFIIRRDSESWLVRVLKSGRRYEPLTKTEAVCDVYFDPRTQKPDVMDTPFGLLWRAGGKAVKI